MYVSSLMSTHNDKRHPQSNALSLLAQRLEGCMDENEGEPLTVSLNDRLAHDLQLALALHVLNVSIAHLGLLLLAVTLPIARSLAIDQHEVDCVLDIHEHHCCWALLRYSLLATERTKLVESLGAVN